RPEQRRDSIEQLECHVALRPHFLAPTRRASTDAALFSLLSSFCLAALLSPSNAARTSPSRRSATPSCALTSGWFLRAFIAAVSSLNWRRRPSAASRRPALTSRATSSC